jgi:transposase
MWTNENRARYDRSHLRYPSDLTDDEWKLVEPLIPPGKPGDGKRRVIMREIANGLMYVPKDLPPKSSVYDYFDLWTYDGTLDRIHHALYQQCREREQREASPTAAIIDRDRVGFSPAPRAHGRASYGLAPFSVSHGLPAQ